MDKNLYVGLDPEFLVLDGANRIIPASAFLSTGDKDAPVAWDNAAVELRPAPTYCLAAFMGNVRELVWGATRELRLARRQGHISKHASPTLAPAASLHPASFDDETVMQFGCSPAVRVDADLGIEEVQPYAGPEFPYRSAGFHIHRQLHPVIKYAVALENVAKRVAILDATIGLVDVMMCHRADWREQSQIRRLGLGYGQAGEFRLKGKKNHLFEYRSMSPWALSGSIWTWWACSAVRQVMDLSNEEVDALLSNLPKRRQIVETINECDSKAEKLWPKVVKTWNGVVYGGMYGRYGPPAGNNSLHPDNIQALQWALDRGGHTAYTLKRPLNRAWYLGSVGPVRSVLHRGRYHAAKHHFGQYRRKIDRRRKNHKPILNVERNQRMEPGNLTGFPRGSSIIRSGKVGEHRSDYDRLLQDVRIQYIYNAPGV